MKVSGAFLDILEAFDKVWHEGLIFELKQYDKSANLLNLICDFLRNTNERVLLNWQVSDCFDVKAVVPQDSILVPLLIFNMDQQFVRRIVFHF